MEGLATFRTAVRVRLNKGNELWCLSSFLANDRDPLLKASLIENHFTGIFSKHSLAKNWVKQD